MTRNKNTKGTGDRGALPESLVGKLMKQERRIDELEKKLGTPKPAEPAPPPPPAPEPEPEPKPKEKKPVAPAPPPPEKKEDRWGGGFKKR